MNEIKLTDEELRALLRCLDYGQNAISQAEVDNGTGEALEACINNIRRKVCKCLQIPQYNLKNKVFHDLAKLYL